MANVFGKPGKRFSIDDAFEEESDPATTINVYGSTTERSPLKPKIKHKCLGNDAVIDVDQNAPLDGFGTGVIKHNEDTLSRDSDSFMHDANGTYANFFDRSQWCCYHPKVKDNWKTVLAAVVLLIVGTVLLVIGLIFVISPDPNLQGIVFIIAGLICFIPGSYHVVYIYFAVIGKDDAVSSSPGALIHTMLTFRCWPINGLGRNCFFNVIRFGHTQCNAKAKTSTKFNFRHAVKLVNKRYYDIERVVKVQSNDSRDPIFLFPGFEGRLDAMSPLVENIGRTTFCLQYPFEGSPRCISKTAEIILPHVENCINEVKSINIVAHSFGGLIAIDLIKLLEAKGIQVRLCLTDSSPYALKVFGFHAFGDVYSAEFETNMIIVLLNSLEIKNIDQFHDVIESTGVTFDEKIEILSPMLAKFCPLDPTEITLFCQGLFNLTKSMLMYDESFLKLKCQAALIRPDIRIWEFPDDYKISNYFEKPVPTFSTDGHHVSMLKSSKTAALVNKIFDE